MTDRLTPDEQARFVAALDRMHPPTRNLFLLFAVNGLSLAAIAEGSSLPRDHVARQVLKAIVTLKRATFGTRPPWWQRLWWLWPF